MNTAVLINVENALIIKEANKKRINQELLDRLKKNNLRNIYLYDEKNDQLIDVDITTKQKKTKTIAEILLEQGFKVQGIYTTLLLKDNMNAGYSFFHSTDVKQLKHLLYFDENKNNLVQFKEELLINNFNFHLTTCFISPTANNVNFYYYQSIKNFKKQIDNDLQSTAVEQRYLKFVLKEAVEEYIEHNLNIKWCLWHWHGKTGVIRARKFLQDIKQFDHENSLMEHVHSFLTNSNNNGNTHPHSLRTMILAKLLKNDDLHEVSANFEVCVIKLKTKQLTEFAPSIKDLIEVGCIPNSSPMQ